MENRACEICMSDPLYIPRPPPPHQQDLNMLKVAIFTMFII